MQFLLLSCLHPEEWIFPSRHTTLGGLIAAIAETNGVPLVFSILLALLVGASVGVLNSILVEKFEMLGFIATMATSYVVKRYRFCYHK